jgi:predicted transposase YbfD/YdcC
VKKWAADLIREQFGIPGCRSLIRLDKEVRREGELLSYETRYFISSLDPHVVSATEFQNFILRHWEVENCLHLQKDKYNGEDKHVFLRTDLAEVWTVLTNIGLSLARLYHKGERTLREVRERFLANPNNAFK